jgi:Lrp/AsnC family leucine-responsive transcriptional regulator
MKFDELDRKILMILQRDARLSFRKIAEQIGITTATVSGRVRRLEGRGLLAIQRSLIMPF